MIYIVKIYHQALSKVIVYLPTYFTQRLLQLRIDSIYW